MQQFVGLFPNRTLYYGLVQTGMARAFVADFAYVNRIAQERIERTPRERSASRLYSVLGYANLGTDLASIEFILEQSHATQFTVSLEDISDRISFGRVDNQLALAHLVAERNQAA